MSPEFQTQIQDAFRRDSARGQSGRWELRFEDLSPPVLLLLDDGDLQVLPADQAQRRATVTFWFPDPATASAILCGRRNFLEAFMAGELRSDGHLILSLQLILQYFGQGAGSR